ncbi:MAG: type IV toxin-antitoxin system AbiEi family antitoxin domain-containing protein [Propionibacteriaceae bacterium]|nr:type IV toxin-antitoxin system AbiEi family antitoxin domain-containing protein [Propionibacteriaceae bacterium]
MSDALPSAFTLADARRAGLCKDQVYRRVEQGDLERVGRGAYIKADSLDSSLASLAAATAVKPASTMCLASALARHGLSDAIPADTDIALPRGARHPAGFGHVAWHSFDPATFDIGREPLDGHSGLFCYSPERSVVDAFRLAHREGADTATTALKRWLRRRGNYPAKLLDMARAFPKAYPAIRSTLEILI